MQTSLHNYRPLAINFPFHWLGLSPVRSLCVVLFGLLLSSSGVLWAQTTVTFNYNGTNGTDGSVQTYTVPAGVFLLKVVAFAAQGGNGPQTVGKGGKVEALLQVSPGQILNIYVGGKPPEGAFAGYNGGGTGAAKSDGTINFTTGGGGGATDIRLNGTSLTDRVIVAGGGGGIGNGRVCAGDGGGLIGGKASNCPAGGEGGTQLAGGAGGAGSGTTGTTGSLGKGGDVTPTGGFMNSGAGGGGYYGGGSGGDFVGGGGGSSYTNATLTSNVIHTQGVQSGNGQVVISQPCVDSPPSVNLTNNGPVTCSPRQVTLTASSASAGTYTFSSPAVPTGSNTATATQAGIYSVTLTTALGCTATAQSTITTNTTAPTGAVITASPNSTLTCAQTAVTLTASATGDGLSYSFSGPGVEAQSGPSATVNAPGTYTVLVTGANSCTAFTTTGVSSDTTVPIVTLVFSNSATVVVNGSPTITVPSGTGNQFRASNGVSYDYISLLDRINGYEIRHKESNTTGIFTIERLGPFSVIVTGRNGCSRTVQGILANP